MKKVIAIHLLLRFNAASFETDAPKFFDRFPKEINSKHFKGGGGGFGNTHDLKLIRVDGASFQEEDRAELLKWLNQQPDVKVLDCRLADSKEEPYAPIPSLKLK